MQVKFHIFTLFVMLIALAGCGSNATTPTPNPIVTQASDVQKATHDSGSVSASGIILPAREAQLSFAQSGWLEEIHVQTGDSVESGQTLAGLEGRQRLEASVVAAETEVLAAQQALDRLYKDVEVDRAETYQQLLKAHESVSVAKRNLYYFTVPANMRELTPLDGLQKAEQRLEAARQAYDPYKYKDERDLWLLKKNNDSQFTAAKDELEWAQSDYNNALRRLEFESALISAKTDLEETQKDFEVLQQGPDPEDVAMAQARLENATASLKVAKASLNQLTLRAPFAGKVVKVDIYPGESVAPGQAIIILGDLDHLWVETSDLSERDVSEVALGQKTNVYIEALNMEIGGKVVEIAPQANTIGGDVVYTVTIELDQQPEGMRWGMSVDVEIVTE
jgi:multidrug efflux pump subunit AcrA (membrane-fusion protein)